MEGYRGKTATLKIVVDCVVRFYMDICDINALGYASSPGMPRQIHRRLPMPHLWRHQSNHRPEIARHTRGAILESIGNFGDAYFRDLGFVVINTQDTNTGSGQILGSGDPDFRSGCDDVNSNHLAKN